jgi:hypothetical protein
MQTGRQYYDYLVQAERVRWKMEDLPWDQIDERAVDDDLIELVKAAVAAEFGTYGATERFLEAFARDVDFTQWVSIWFYEETKHPQALMQWLSRFGVSFEPEEVLDLRQTEPFVRSNLGTLAINIIAEMQAAESYIGLAEGTHEPVLRELAFKIAADEARHASHFFGFASRLLAADTSATDRHAPLAILWLWLTRGELIRHPGQITMMRLLGSNEVTTLSGVPSDVRWRRLQDRVCASFGRLVGVPELRTPEDVPIAMKKMRKSTSGADASTAADLVGV